MAKEERLIDANAVLKQFDGFGWGGECDGEIVLEAVADAPTVDAVEIPDKELLKAVKLLIKQYGHSKQSDYVHNPVAHAFYYTWKQLDDGRRE